MAMSEDNKSNSDGPSLPPKLDLRQKGILPSKPAQAPEAGEDAAPPEPAPAQPAASEAATAPEAGDPKTAETVRPGGIRPRTGIRAPIRPTSAKTQPATSAESDASDDVPAPPAPPGRDEIETTMKIDLDEDKQDTAKSEKPKTIRINIPTEGAGTSAAASGTKPGTTAPRRKTKTSPIPKPTETSPIPLDKLGGEQSETQPKTIRLKRPGGVGAAPPTRKESPPTPVTVADAVEAQDDSAAAEDEAATEAALAPAGKEKSTTQKKTIKVKRPTRGSGKAKPMTIARAGDKAAQQGKSEEDTVQPTLQAVGLTPASAEQESGAGSVLTVIAGIAAVFVVGALLYMLSVQAFPGMEFSWPGQI
jgi:hypothetical protein